MSQVPESSEGIFGYRLNLITLNEPVEDKMKTLHNIKQTQYTKELTEYKNWL